MMHRAMKEGCMTNRIVTLVTAVGLALVLGGCKSDCRVVCEKQQECFSADLNIDSCTDSCSEKGDDDQDYADKTQECAECVSERVCSEAAQSCLDDCFGIVFDND
jgi:hypothetical protein